VDELSRYDAPIFLEVKGFSGSETPDVGSNCPEQRMAHNVVYLPEEDCMDRRVFLSLGSLIASPMLADNLFGQTARGPASKAEDEVRRAEQERFAAMLKADVGALDRLLGADLTYTHGDARVIDKAAFISDFKTGAFKYVTIEPNEMMVRVFGDVAVVTGGAAMHVVNNGTPANIKIRYTDVHVKRNGSWQMVAWEATRLPQ
jgi:ketosteroid isomerase-like protein